MKESNINYLNPAPVAMPSDNNETDIDYLKENYLTNISKYQKVKRIVEGTNKEVELCPNVCFHNQKDYYIFYNDNLKKLKEYFEEELKSLYKNHNCILYHKKNNLHDSLSLSKFNPEMDKEKGPLKYLSFFLGSFRTEWIDYANFLGRNISLINEVIEKYSHEIKQGKVCQLIVSTAFFDEDIKKEEFEESDKEKKLNYTKYFKEIEEIKESKIKRSEKLKLLEAKIDNYNNEIQVENNIDTKKAYCFVLNMIEKYLTNFEDAKENKEPDVLKAMYNLKIKLVANLYGNIFKSVQNGAPILNIIIDKYQLIKNDINETIIFMEKTNANKFLDNLKEALESKAKNIDRKYQFRDIELNEIKNIAKEINFNNLEDLINNYDSIIIEKQSMLKTKNVEFFSFTTKKAINTVGKFFVKDFTNLFLNKEGKKIQIPENKIEEFLSSDKKLMEENIKTKIEKNDEKETKNNENNHNKVSQIEKKSEKDKNEIKENNEKEVFNNINEGLDKVLEKRKQNLNSLGIDAFNFTNEIIDDVRDILLNYIDMKNIHVDIKKYENILKQIKIKKQYYYDFFNALKLYYYLEKKINDEKKMKYGLVLIEQNKEKTDDLREYSVEMF